MNLGAIDRFIDASILGLAYAGTDNRVKPLLELAPYDFADFLRHVNPLAIVTSISGEIEYRGAIIRVKRP